MEDNELIIDRLNNMCRLLVLLTDVVIKTHDYENLTAQKELLKNLAYV